MERIVRIIVSWIIGLVGFSTPVTTSQEAVPFPTTTPPVAKTITVEGKPYAYAVIGPVAPSKVRLASNLPNKQSANELKQTHSCTALTSGGFYSSTDQPIGLFIVDNIVRQSQSSNLTFNGLLWVTEEGKAGIQTELPDEPIAFALQTGPILSTNGKARTLRLKTDENARRIVVGVTAEHTLVFFAVYQEANTFLGANLQDLPNIVAEISIAEGLQIREAINLDGGNHSAFKSPDIDLPELAPIGSYFCIQ